jgi:hypothetical protein
MYIISMNRSRNRKDVYYLNQIWRIPLESEDPNPGIDKNTIVYKENNDTTVLRDERYVHSLRTRYPRFDRFAAENLESIHSLVNPYRK